MEPVAHGHSTSVFVVLCRLLEEHREDLDKLAVVAEACHLRGYPVAAHLMSRGSDDDNIDLINRALFRRNKRILRARALGLLIAVDALAVDAEAMARHRVQEDAAVIECCVLSLDERAQKLREAGLGMIFCPEHAP